MNRCALLTASVTWWLAFGVPDLAHAQSPRPLPLNEQGLPVVSVDGSRLEYSRQQLELQLGARAGEQAGRAVHATGAPAPRDGTQAALTDIQPTWQYFAFGTGIGASRFVVSAVDGMTEIVAGGGGSGFGADSYWFILRFDSVTKGYDQVFVSPVVPAGESIRRLALATTDAGPKLVVGISKGNVQVWDQAKRTLDLQFQVPGNSIEALCVADVVPGGRPEIVISSATHLYVCRMEGDVIWDLSGVGGKDVIAAQMDDDPGLEIATTDGRVVDADSHAVQWTWPAGFGFALRAGDIDADGKAELIGAPAWSFIWAYDVDKQLPKWSIPVFNVGAINLTDIDGDGTLELLVGEAQWGEALAYDTVTQQLEWAIPNPEHGTTDITYGDVDGDGTTEIIWGAGFTSTGPDIMFVADWTTQQMEWNSIHLIGPFRGPVRGDVDGDGAPEIVSVSNDSDSGFGGGMILVFDGEDLQLRAISDEVAYGWSGTWDVKLRNVDADPALEILVGTSTTYDGTIAIFDYDGAETFTKIWEVPPPFPDGAFRCADVADVDGDGQLEVVGGAENFVYVYQLAPAQEEWHSLSVGPYVSGMALGQTDGDASTEIIALGSSGGAYIFDGTSKSLEALLPGTWRCVRSTPAGPGQPELIVLGDNVGGVTAYQHDGTGYAVVKSASFGTKPIDGITLGPLDFIWVGASGTLSLYDGWGGALLWSSGPFGTLFGTDAILFYPGARTVLTAGSYGLTGFSPN
jgi:hypothetical protein